MNIIEMMTQLNAEKIKTWFDLGLFIDRVKEGRKNPTIPTFESYQKFKQNISDGGVAFVSFFFSVDGASMECEKYVRALQNSLGSFDVHYIAGRFYETGNQFLQKKSNRLQFDELKAFDDWDLYKDFFYKKLERGGKVYNSLIIRFWKQVLTIAKRLGKYVEDNKIRLLYLVNINSNPGNISEALALVLISEYMGIPVISNNHDFYWEGGNNEVEILEGGLIRGPRDHFFKNYHLGEVFSLLEVIYPWESRNWLSLNINEYQCKNLVNEQGYNPANVMLVDTCVDIQKFRGSITAERKKEVVEQICSAFKGTSNKLSVISIEAYLANPEKGNIDLKPTLFGIGKVKTETFCRDNIIMLQPTRILKRKAIEIDFVLVKKLLADPDVIEYLEANENAKLTILVTGPVAIGQREYFYQVLKHFSMAICEIDEQFRSRVFLGFLFSEFDKKAFKSKYKNPLTLQDLYKITSIILLPSTTEGRGLPIIEAAASGTPIFCRRYYPDHVFAHVIGENLPKTQQLSVISFKKPELSGEIIELVKRQIFAPKTFATMNERNKEIVKNRYSFERLNKTMEDVLYQLFLQISSGKDELELAHWALESYKKHIQNNKSFASGLLNTENRQYLAGYGQMRFMIMLKSLIDPSYFRVEEKKIRGLAMQFAKELVENTPDPSPLPAEIKHKFYNGVDSLFLYHEKDMDIRFDHAMAYRHRNKIYYPYQDLTPQELTGVINFLFNCLTSPPPVTRIGGVAEIRNDWYKNLAILYDNQDLAIDHVDDLEENLMQNVPVALFPGKYIELELELFVLEPVRRRLRLAKNEIIDERTVNREALAPIYIIQHETSLGNSVTESVLKSYVYYSGNSELITLFKQGICKILPSRQKSVGVHLYEIGEKAANALLQVKKQKGIIITTGDQATMMTDILDIDRFHIGKVSNIFAANILGIPFGSGYVQWVPAGLRFALAYPTSVQTGKDFSKTLKGFRFQRLSSEMGQEKVLNILKEDAREKSSPINIVLKNLDKKDLEDGSVTFSAVNGIYSDGMPWSGAIAQVKTNSGKKPWKYTVLSTKEKPKTVLQFAEEFNNENKAKVRVAWNGGYILNPELVGKLGIPEVFIGSPLGLIISDNKLQSVPLFNKAAFLVSPDGKLKIKRVNSHNGICVKTGGKEIRFNKENYNLRSPVEAACFYDLLYSENIIPGNGRTIIRLAGNMIKDIIHSKPGENIAVLPVGLSLSLPNNMVPKSWESGLELNIEMLDWEPIVSAIEAGPQLLEDGQECLDMELEGWKTVNSINTQAARLDFTDMRGPKIAIGIDEKGDLFILTVNGRIRESVGATHFDMAEILRKRGMVQAMGFDPGGSSTLVVDNKTLNISPYNHDYEKNVYALPPEPRAVANALLIWE